MPTFTFRLVQRTYHNRLENEDGPGSLTNIVADRNDRVIATWRNEDEDFGQKLIEQGVSLHLPESSDDGWIEYSHQLERRPEGAAEAPWEYVGHVQSKLKEEEYDCDDDRWDYLEEEEEDPEDDE